MNLALLLGMMPTLGYGIAVRLAGPAVGVWRSIF
jgi:hypothetical protein